MVNCSDCFWVGCLWFVVLKCLRSIVFMLCMLWVVRFGVQGLEDGQTMANPILTIYIRIAEYTFNVIHIIYIYKYIITYIYIYDMVQTEIP